MKQIYIDVPEPSPMSISRKVFHFVIGMFLSPLFWVLSHRYNMPGLEFHRECVKLGVYLLFNRKATSLSYTSIYHLLFFPMDSTRYFEFDFVWKTLNMLPAAKYLDVSSPRVIPLLYLCKHPKLKAELINPDSNDYEITADFLDALGLSTRCKLQQMPIEAVPFKSASFDVITSISVLEHIPGNGSALRKMWELLKPGGKLILTVPCMAEATEQYISENEYGLLTPGEDGYTFWQLYYDSVILKEKIFPITGKPARMVIYGEKEAGSFAKNAHLKRSRGAGYPFWREPYVMGSEYAYFQSIQSLPGEGVVAMEFVK